MEYTSSATSTRVLDIWINRDQLKAFEGFIFGIEYNQMNVINVRLVDNPGVIFQTYTTELVTYANRSFFAFKTK